MTRLIKRYKNRKLYDTQTAKYVNLNDIATIITSGHNIQVIDLSTNRDITYMIQIQILMLSADKPSSKAFNHIIRENIGVDAYIDNKIEDVMAKLIKE